MDLIAPDLKAAPTLAQASEYFGVESTYWDIFGKQHEASEKVQKNILTSLGLDTSSDQALEKALEDHQWRVWSQPLPSTVVVSQSTLSFPISIPAKLGKSAAVCIILHEDGSKSEHTIPLANLPVTSKRTMRKQDYIRKEVSLKEVALPLGYHQISLTLEGEPQTTARFIVTPDQTFQPEWLESGRAAGLAVSLYGVRSDRNWGCGDATDLWQLVDWVGGLGASFLALNPLHAIANRQPYNTSPYLPNSIFFRNHIYLDVEKIPDFAASAWAQRLFHSAKVQRELASLRDSTFVEYERVSRLKLEFLKVLFLNFLIKEYRRDTESARQFKAYVDREGDLLHKFALHSALDESIHKANRKAWNWPAWPAPFQDPSSPETAAFETSHWRSILLHKYIQWQLDRQFQHAQDYARDRGLGIGLYHDLALATDRFGSDLWAHRAFYAAGSRVGSPPDNFSPKGQDWAFPPPNAVQHFEDGYRLFADSIRKASANGGALRIDHVMRFFRLYWIPDGVETADGTYVKDRYDELIRILALESVRNQFIVIGEDLGTVPDYVRETLQKFGILSYRLFYFEQDAKGRFYRPDEYPRQALVSATTHDLPTLAGFWTNADIYERRKAGVLPDDEALQKALDDRITQKQRMLDLLHDLKLIPEWVSRDAHQIPELTGELHNAMVGFLAATPSQLFVLNQEDLFKDTEQQNLPGTTAEHPNWRHKMKYKLEELASDSVIGYSLMLRSWIQKSGRLDPSKTRRPT